MALVDLLAPPALDFGRQNLVLGDQVGRVLVILDYPPSVGPAWLARVVTMPGVTASLHLAPSDPVDLLKALNASVQEYASRLAQGGNALSQSRWQQRLDHAKALLKKIDQEGQKVFRFGAVLLVLAPDEEELSRRVRHVEGVCAGAGMRVRPAVFRQEDGLRAAGPWALLPAEIDGMVGREWPAETVAATYPWIAEGLVHGRGCVWGKDAGGGLVLLDRWRPPAEAGLTNGNVNVFGMPGSGKSFASMLQVLREYAQGARVLVVDPEGEYKRLARALGGQVVDAAGGRGRVNPHQVPVVPDDDEEDDEDAPEAGGGAPGAARGPLAQHMQRVKTFYGLYLPALDALEQAVLEKAILEAYRGRGVGWDTDPAGVTEWPTVADVQRILRERPEPEAARLALLLESAAEGADSALWAGQSTIEIGTHDFVVLDIKRLKEAAPNVRRAQFFNILSFAWDLVREGRALARRTILVVDEAWILIDPQTPQTLEFLKEMSKRIRKYGQKPVGGSLSIVTQNVGDFLAPEVERLGKPVVTNAGIKLLMRQDPADLERLREAFRLTEAECDLLASARRGEGLLIAGNQRAWVKVEAAPYELEILGVN